jgi:hypothetical protein
VGVCLPRCPGWFDSVGTHVYRLSVVDWYRHICWANVCAQRVRTCVQPCGPHDFGCFPAVLKHRPCRKHRPLLRTRLAPRAPNRTDTTMLTNTHILAPRAPNRTDTTMLTNTHILAPRAPNRTDTTMLTNTHIHGTYQVPGISLLW